MAATEQPLLAFRDVHAYRGEAYVLQGVSLALPPGTCVGLLGRNGMGKTTLVRTAMGLERARSGSIRLAGEELVGRSPTAIGRRGVGYVPQGRKIFGSLSVEENLRVVERGGGEWTRERVYELFPRLRERRRQRGQTLSGGEQQMLAIGRALVTNPRVVLMDEPSEGLAPGIIDVVQSVIGQLVESGLSILLVEQNYRLAVETASRIFILDRGTIAWEGTPETLEREPAVTQELLGV
jgi:branched-chain amino acid transport system ATP-binding protein